MAVSGMTPLEARACTQLGAIRATGTDHVPVSPRQPCIWMRETGARAMQGCHLAQPGQPPLPAQSLLPAY